MPVGREGETPVGIDFERKLMMMLCQLLLIISETMDAEWEILLIELSDIRRREGGFFECNFRDLMALVEAFCWMTPSTM
jgi:hypothetical protein